MEEIKMEEIRKELDSISGDAYLSALGEISAYEAMVLIQGAARRIAKALDELDLIIGPRRKVYHTVDTT